MWWVFDPDHSAVDPIYDVGTADGIGRRWRGPYDLPVIRAVIKQGNVPNSKEGYFNADTLHLTINAEDVDKIAPGVLKNPDLQNRGRIVWLNSVFRPIYVQQSGIVADRFSLVQVNCIQITPDELINDPQFSAYAPQVDAATSIIKTTLPPRYGYGAGPYGDDTPNVNGYGD